MHPIVFCVVVIVILALLLWAAEYLPIPTRPKQLIFALLIVLGALLIADKFNVF